MFSIILSSHTLKFPPSLVPLPPPPPLLVLLLCLCIPLSNPPLPRPAGCVTFPTGYTPSLEEACSEMDKNQALITMFNENYVPKNCRSAIEGVWHFAYQNRFR